MENTTTVGVSIDMYSDMKIDKTVRGRVAR